MCVHVGCGSDKTTLPHSESISSPSGLKSVCVRVSLRELCMYVCVLVRAGFLSRHTVCLCVCVCVCVAANKHTDG